MATAGVTYVCGNWLPEARIIGIELRVPGRYSTIPTPAEELCNPGPYLTAIRVEIEEKISESVQLRGLDGLSRLI